MGSDYVHHIGLDSNEKNALVVPLLPLGTTKQHIDSAPHNQCRFHSIFCFLFWSMKLQKYEKYFFIIRLARLALQTENIVKKITQPKVTKIRKTKLPK